MMKTLKKILLFGTIFLLIKCEEKEIVVVPKGDIVGFVSLYDENCEEIKNAKGVSVSIDETNFETITDEIGRFEFKNIPAGSYNFTFQKEGFSEQNRYLGGFVGGNIPDFLYHADLYKYPDIYVQNVNTFVVDSFLMINGTLPKVNTYRMYFMFSNVVEELPDNSDYFRVMSHCCDTVTQFDYVLNVNRTPFVKGDKIYMKIYFTNLCGSIKLIEGSETVEIVL